MSNAEFNTLLNKPTKAMTSNSEIAKTEKIILGVLLFIIGLILGLILIVISQKMLQNRPQLSSANNRLMVGAERYYGIFGTDSTQYIFSLEESKKTNIKLFSDLPRSVELSPDGQWIVFGITESTGDGFSEDRIYIMRADGTQQTRVPIPYTGEDPTWSPDGKQIAFFGFGSEPGIYIANIECLLRGESCTPAPRLLVESPICRTRTYFCDPC